MNRMFVVEMCDGISYSGKSCDEGKSFLSEFPESPATLAYKRIIDSEFTCYTTVQLQSLVSLPFSQE